MKATATIRKKNVKGLSLWLHKIGVNMDGWDDERELRPELDVDDDNRVVGWEPSFTMTWPIPKPAGLEEKGGSDGQDGTAEKA